MWEAKPSPYPPEHIAFIRRISTDHPEWGEDRIAEELALKLGVTVLGRRRPSLAEHDGCACWADKSARCAEAT